MVTVIISIKPYLAKFMYVRYGHRLEPQAGNAASALPVPIHLTHIHPVYHQLYNLSVPNPGRGTWREKGNICFVLPKPNGGKDPLTYNYIGADSAMIIEKEIEVRMKAELFMFLLDNKFKKGIMYKKSMHQFVEMYNMEETVEEESLMKAFQRWRNAVKADKKS